MSYGYGTGYEGAYGTGGSTARNYYQGYGNQSAANSSYRKPDFNVFVERENKIVLRLI
jgi:hypothetical protein